MGAHTLISANFPCPTSPLATGIFTSNLSSGVSDISNVIKSQSADNPILLGPAMDKPIIDRHELCQTLCHGDAY